MSIEELAIRLNVLQCQLTRLEPSYRGTVQLTGQYLQSFREELREIEMGLRSLSVMEPIDLPGQKFTPIHRLLPCDCMDCSDCHGKKVVCGKCKLCTRCSSHIEGCEGCVGDPVSAFIRFKGLS